MISFGLNPNVNLTSTSFLGTGNEPWMAGLTVGPGAKAWCAVPSDMKPYLQIDLGQIVVVLHSEKKKKSGQGMVTTFTLSSSEEGGFWRMYKEGSQEKVIIYYNITILLFSHLKTSKY